MTREHIDDCDARLYAAVCSGAALSMTIADALGLYPSVPLPDTMV